MSSKFFTWTKGDRKHAADTLQSGGVVSNTTETVSFRALDVAKSPKLRRKSPPCNRCPRSPFEVTPISPCSPSSDPKATTSPTNTPLALQNVAVQSATSLMVVMNDMLRSPKLAAHLRLRPSIEVPRARPRSHTAPSTPLCEAPSMEPAELPGSFPGEEHPLYPPQLSTDAAYTPNEALGQAIQRPHTSPHSPLSRFHDHSRSANNRASGTELDRRISYTAARTGPSSSIEQSQTDNVHAGPLREPMHRPSLTVLQPWPSNQQASPVSTPYTTPQTRGSSFNRPALKQPSPSLEDAFQDGEESALLHQISSMRERHDAHISSLKETHHKEVASHLSYIALLERRQMAFKPINITGDQFAQTGLKIVTSPTSALPTELPELDGSAVTLGSFESALECQRRTSQDAVAEVESLRRKLSVCRKEQAELTDIRLEKDQLRDALDRRDRRVIQLKGVVRKAKENEKALENAITGLEARLDAANNQRMDVLEGFQSACNKADELVKNETAAKRELTNLRDSILSTQITIAARNVSNAEVAEHEAKQRRRSISNSTSPLHSNNPLLEQINQLRDLIDQKDARTTQLECDAPEPASNLKSQQHTNLTNLQATLEERERTLSKVEADRDRYNTLLHNELRRQSRQMADKGRMATPSINAEGAIAVQKLLAASNTEVEKQSGSLHDPNINGSQTQAVTFEKALNHCISEIIMYKLDVRGYKKDLRRAQTELDSLRAMTACKPPTPDHDSIPSSSSESSRDKVMGKFQDVFGSGLGISLAQTPQTPTKQCAAQSEAISPLHRPKTPVVSHEKARKTMLFETPSPLPEQKTTAATPRLLGSIRSVSEQGMSSHAQFGLQEKPLPKLVSG